MASGVTALTPFLLAGGLVPCVMVQRDRCGRYSAATTEWKRGNRESTKQDFVEADGGACQGKGAAEGVGDEFR